MTKNQIEYLKVRETQRANLAQEALTQARDIAARELGFGTLEESKRSNLMREALTRDQNVETERAHRMAEQLQQGSLDETSRSNLAREAISRDTLAETKRSNIARETISRDTLTEQQRANLASEAIRNMANAIQSRSVANQYAVGMANVAELQRSHLASEQQRAQEIDISGARQRADARYQLANTVLGGLNLLETGRHARQTESVAKIQAKATSKQAQVAQQRADTESARVSSEIDLNKQRNVRDWLNLAGDAVGGLFNMGNQSAKTIAQYIQLLD